ncbi:MAG: hypothetical protein WCQ57_05495 [Verrucomicrobiota bacterium]
MRACLILALAPGVLQGAGEETNTGQPNLRPRKILTFSYTMGGVNKTKQTLEGETLLLD